MLVLPVPSVDLQDALRLRVDAHVHTLFKLNLLISMKVRFFIPVAWSFYTGKSVFSIKWTVIRGDVGQKVVIRVRGAPPDFFCTHGPRSLPPLILSRAGQRMGVGERLPSDRCVIMTVPGVCTTSLEDVHRLT